MYTRIYRIDFRNDDIRFVTVSGGDLHHHRKEFADGQVLLLTNVSLDEPTAVEVALDGKYVVRMDALDGKTYQIPYTSGDGKVAVKTTIEPAGSVLLRVVGRASGRREGRCLEWRHAAQGDATAEYRPREG